VIRPFRAADAPSVLALARETGLLTSAEIEDLRWRLDYHPQRPASHRHRALVWEEPGALEGAVYYAPVAMTDRTWTLHWLLARPPFSAHGVAGWLLHEVEEDVRREQGRLLVVETSSRPAVEGLRCFYEERLFEPSAVLPDFYADGEAQVIFRKRL
jgi:GNAT superfamily N-acetyltransferase